MHYDVPKIYSESQDLFIKCLSVTVYYGITIIVIINIGDIISNIIINKSIHDNEIHMLLRQIPFGAFVSVNGIQISFENFEAQSVFLL